MKPSKRPIDVKDTLRSELGKDTLDAAAERLWNNFIPRGTPELPYHLQHSLVQELMQRAVLDVLGNAVPALLRQRAKEVKRNDANTECADALFELADELETDHG